MRVLTPEEINENYNAIYTKIFKAHPTNQIPRTVVVQEKDNEVIGFVSGYLIDRETFYLAWGGTVSTFTQARSSGLRVRRSSRNRVLSGFKLTLRTQTHLGREF